MPDQRSKSSIYNRYRNEFDDLSFTKRSQTSVSTNARLQLRKSDSKDSFHDLDGHLLSRPDYHKILHQRIKYKIDVYGSIRRLEVDKNVIFQNNALKDQRYLKLVDALQPNKTLLTVFSNSFFF
jgi:hypothetical protein